MLDAEAIKSALSDPRNICGALGLLDHARRSVGGLLIRCPSHDERTPSCSVTRGPDGTIRVRCFACGFTGDVFSLVAAVDGLGTRRDFMRVIERAARLAGLDADVESGPRPMAPPPPDCPFPPQPEVERLWDNASPLAQDHEAAEYFASRGLDAHSLDTCDLVRAIGRRLPAWAIYGAGDWNESGHRAIVRMFDPSGTFRSVRAIRIRFGGSDIPKRLPPKGYRASGLVMANEFGRGILDGTNRYGRMLICEGEPDFLTVSTEPFGEPQAVLGIVSGSWTGAMAARISDAAEVLVMTHNDKAGDGYAREINSTIGHRCNVLRAKVPT